MPLKVKVVRTNLKDSLFSIILKLIYQEIRILTFRPEFYFTFMINQCRRDYLGELEFNSISAWKVIVENIMYAKFYRAQNIFGHIRLNPNQPNKNS